MLKADIRREYLAKQKAMTPVERSDRSRRIADRFFSSFPLIGIQYLHCFIAIEKFNEIDTTVIFQKLWDERSDIVTLVPKVDLVSGEIRNVKFSRDTDLIANVWGIREPAHDMYVNPSKIDIVLIPLLAFDQSGHRVGYGKGFYDKLLAKCRRDCLKIGLSYFAPVERIDDLTGYDIRLDACVTDNAVFHFE